VAADGAVDPPQLVFHRFVIYDGIACKAALQAGVGPAPSLQVVAEAPGLVVVVVVVGGGGGGGGGGV
jgi:hypothetical protein